MTLLKFHATWCSPCKVLSKNLENFKIIPIENIDIDSQQEKVDDFNIRNIPTLILLDENKKEIWRKNGIISIDELNNKILEINNTKIAE